MMKSKPVTVLQKTYDDCYLICSTAVYFEGKNNEAEALRAWKNALDQLQYHKAFKLPSNFRPKTETEKALNESLRELELQCKERVDLLEALKQSREDVPPGAADSTAVDHSGPLIDLGPPTSSASSGIDTSKWLGGGTVEPFSFPALSKPPTLSYHRNNSNGNGSASANQSSTSLGESSSHPTLPPRPSTSASASVRTSSELPVSDRKPGRSPSPDKRGLLRTLRAPVMSKKRPSSSTRAPVVSPSRTAVRPQPAALAATQAWESKASSAYELAQPDRFDAHAAMQARSRSTEALSGTSKTVAGLPPVNLTYGGEPRRPSAQSNYNAELRRPTVEPRRPSAPSTVSKGGFSTVDMERKYSADANSADAMGGLSRSRAPAIPRKPPPMSSRPKPASPGGPTRKKPEGQTTRHENGPGPHTPVTKKLANAPEAVDDDAVPSIVEPPSDGPESEWDRRVAHALQTLPKAIDRDAAKQIVHEIVSSGDHVTFADIAGLSAAKRALKETVIYPFLRPDLFHGLREPARGLLLFGPPGTGKTMLARAVATESQSTFFAISAASLTSKWLGESEKLVRALFALARALSPSIIFVDEIDAILGQRREGEHDATRRVKTEFLIQWSDLARAAAGRPGEGEAEKERELASRVLVLAATNMPWAIDEAARRRFVRRQYIPLPETETREVQLRGLLSHQKHGLSDVEIAKLVELTEGYSGSDITALAKDAAMGPLRSLGERLLEMTMDEIRPMQFEDFEASLESIKPSVTQQGLRQFEEWAKEFGERGS